MKHQRGRGMNLRGTHIGIGKPTYSHYTMPCPTCDDCFIIFEKNSSIEVKCEKNGEVKVPGMLKLIVGCKNPLCPSNIRELTEETVDKCLKTMGRKNGTK